MFGGNTGAEHIKVPAVVACWSNAAVHWMVLVYVQIEAFRKEITRKSAKPTAKVRRSGGKHRNECAPPAVECATNDRFAAKAVDDGSETLDDVFGGCEDDCADAEMEVDMQEMSLDDGQVPLEPWNPNRTSHNEQQVSGVLHRVDALLLNRSFVPTNSVAIQLFPVVLPYQSLYSKLIHAIIVV